MIIEPIFPIPVLSSKLNREFSKEELDCILNADRSKSVANFVGTDTYILENPAMAGIKSFIQENLDAYLYNVIKATGDVRLEITQSWLNYTSAGEYHHPHSHTNSYISGVIYIACNEDSLVFYKPRGYYENILHIQPSQFNGLNAETWTIGADVGKLILFPSHLQHGVNPLKEGRKDLRISLAFNSFPKGRIGVANQYNSLIL